MLNQLCLVSLGQVLQTHTLANTNLIAILVLDLVKALDSTSLLVDHVIDIVHQITRWSLVLDHGHRQCVSIPWQIKLLNVVLTLAVLLDTGGVDCLGNLFLQHFLARVVVDGIIDIVEVLIHVLEVLVESGEILGVIDWLALLGFLTKDG